MSTILIKTIWLAWLATLSQAISALRYGSDVSTNDISVEYKSSAFKSYLVMDTSFENIKTTFVMCFKELSLGANTTDSTRCAISGASSGYQCLQYTYASSGVSYYYFSLSDDYSVTTNIQSYTPAEVVSGSSYSTYSISLTGTIAGNTSVNYLSNTKTIYQIRSNNQRTFYGSTTVKENYLSSLTISLNLSSSDMIMQRHAECFVYNADIITGLFYGGVYRFGTQLMMFGVIAVSNSGTSFAGWTGISFSKNHAFRDMVGLVHHTGTITDLKSLIAGAPYADTSTNIGGVQSYTRLSSTGVQNRQQITQFYFTQFYREYSTGDSFGDEDIIFKMNNQYCVATYVTTFSSVTPTTTFSGGPTNSNYQHQTYGCFYPDLTLSQQNIVFCLSVMVLMILFI